MAKDEVKEEVTEETETVAGVSAPETTDDEFAEFEEEETLEEVQAAEEAEEASEPVVAKASSTPAGAPEGSVPATEKKPGKRGRKSQNSKDAIVVQSVATKLDGEDVTLVRKKSSQIKAFKASEDTILKACVDDANGDPNLTGAVEEALEELTAKPTLRKINETNNLGISEEGHNTRQFGKKVMDALEAKQNPAPAKEAATETTEA